MNAVAENNEKTVQPQPVETAREYVTPGVNILETPDVYIVEAEVPGVNKDGLKISVEDNVLTLVGHRQATAPAGVLYRESDPADYRRVFELDPAIETGKITARLERGILTLTLPKSEKAKPRDIAVN